MSVSTVHELPTGSPKWAVTIRSETHVGQHRFHDREDAEAFRLGCLDPPDKFDSAIDAANAALHSGETFDCVRALAQLTAACEHERFVQGRA